eukprot:4658904-Heterocapsa_arctica.AAC.1
MALPFHGPIDDGTAGAVNDANFHEDGPGVLGPISLGYGDEPAEGNGHRGVMWLAAEFPRESGRVGAGGPCGEVGGPSGGSEELAHGIGHAGVALGKG